MAAFLLQLYGAGLVEFRTWLPPIARVAGERPVASPLARWQAQHGDVVSSRFHQAVKVEDEVGRSLLIWLDGTMDRPALAEKIRALFQARDSQAFPDAEDPAMIQKIRQELEQNLAKLAGLGLLVA